MTSSEVATGDVAALGNELWKSFDVDVACKHDTVDVVIALDDDNCADDNVDVVTSKM